MLYQSLKVRSLLCLATRSGHADKKHLHGDRYAAFSTLKQHMNMVAPNVDGTFCVLNVLSKAFKDLGFIIYVAENI